jgi:hypothetical protein
MQLTSAEAGVLDVLTQGKRARERVPIPDRTIVSRFEKYAFPIGLDGAGKPFPIPRRHASQADAGTE